MDIIGTSTKGSKLPHGLCQFQGFFHMLTGNQKINKFRLVVYLFNYIISELIIQRTDKFSK